METIKIEKNRRAATHASRNRNSQIAQLYVFAKFVLAKVDVAYVKSIGGAVKVRAARNEGDFNSNGCLSCAEMSAPINFYWGNADKIYMCRYQIWYIKMKRAAT